MPRSRITVTLPADVVDDIDRRERNRSRFILEAVERELENRRRQELLASIENPHPQSGEIAEEGVDEWGEWGDAEDEDLLDAEAGSPVRWSPGKGWSKVGE